MGISLNVNNPHFLVMQGRIAQVIDMKPLQTLSLIEEASGTSLYENRKLASLKIIQKKQLKVDEISSIVLQEITPQLERLRKEKEVFIKYKANESEATVLWKQLVAAEFLSSSKKEKALGENVGSLRTQGEQLVTLIDSQKNEVDKFAKMIHDAKEREIRGIKAEWDLLQKDLGKLDKDLVDK